MEFMARNILHFISSTHLMQICSQGSWRYKTSTPCFFVCLFIFEAADAKWSSLHFYSYFEVHFR